MPFMQQVLLNVPTFLLGLIIVGGAIVLSIAGLLIVRRYIPHHKLKVHNDVAGPIFSTLGVVYAVLLGFAVIIVWQDFDKSSLNVQREANFLDDLYRDAECFPRDFKENVRTLTNDYAKVVMNEEWKTIAKGQASPRAGEILRKLWALYSSYSPKTETERIFFGESVRKLNNLCELRTMRLLDSRNGIHPLLWFVLITGGITTIAFTFFFGSENLRAQLTMSVLLAILISLILFTILLLDFPFTGDISISSSPFRSAGQI